MTQEKFSLSPISRPLFKAMKSVQRSVFVHVTDCHGQGQQEPHISDMLYVSSQRSSVP